MFNRKKIAAVSGLLGSLVVTCIGAGQAHAAADPGSCTRDILGNITCIQRYEGVLPDGDLYALRQSQSCVPIEPVTIPTGNPLSRGATQIGPRVTCSNATAPVGKEPVPGQEMPALFG